MNFFIMIFFIDYGFQNNVFFVHAFIVVIWRDMSKSRTLSLNGSPCGSFGSCWARFLKNNLCLCVVGRTQ